MQVSRKHVFVFVEGRDLDPDVYSRICVPVCKEAGKLHEIVIADRLGDGFGGGGKGLLTRFFEFLRNNSSLLDRSQHEPKVAMFYFDKDVDDLFNALRKSDHVVYTNYYSIENHIFAEGNLASSLATAGSLDMTLVEEYVTSNDAWRVRAASLWRDWLTLCLLARKLSLPAPVTFAMAASRINNPADSPVDTNALESAIVDMRARSGLGSAAFQPKLNAAYRLVDSFFSDSRHDVLFKGKWYVVFALRELEKISVAHNKHGAADRLLGALIATTNFDAPWTEHFRRPLRTVLEAL